MIYNNILETIGNTPIIKITKFSKKNDVENEMFIKLESKNPGGSAKDRIAYKMINKLFEENKINSDSVIVEVTSGNTGIGLAMTCAYYNIKLIIIINENATSERIKLLEMFGAKIIKINKNKDMNFSIKVAKRLCDRLDNLIFIDQFSNENNYLAHYETTAKEIINDFKNGIDYLFIGMGSTGTIMGVAMKIKQINKNIKIIGVEPEKCPYYKENVVGKSDIPGIGTSFIPYIYNKEYIDDIISSNIENAWSTVKEMMREEGIMVGLSSGAVIYASVNYMKMKEIKNKKVLIISQDSIEKYLSIL